MSTKAPTLRSEASSEALEALMSLSGELEALIVAPWEQAERKSSSEPSQAKVLGADEALWMAITMTKAIATSPKAIQAFEALVAVRNQAGQQALEAAVVAVPRLDQIQEIVRSIEAAFARFEARPIDLDESDWITPGAAASLMGFSRPYVAALIDAGEFGEQAALKSPGGHRRVLRSAVERWMKERGAIAPQSSEAKTLLEAPDDPAFFDRPSARSAPQEARVRKQIASRRALSMQHRPKR